MFAFPKKRTLKVVGGMSAKCPIADIAPTDYFKKVVGNAGAQRTGCEIAFADTTGRRAASAMAMPRPLAMQA
jgi:hypothetical protein